MASKMMTPDQELRQAMLGPAAAKPEKAAKADARAARRDKRIARAERAKSRTWMVRLAVLVLSLSGSAMMLFTESGSEMRREFQTAILDLVQTEMQARREMQAAAIAENQELNRRAVAQLEAVAAQTADTAPAAQVPAPEAITFVPARGSDSGERVVVSQMPESRVAVRRLGSSE